MSFQKDSQEDRKSFVVKIVDGVLSSFKFGIIVFVHAVEALVLFLRFSIGSANRIPSVVLEC